METKDFYHDLPKELIAQTPVEPRLFSLVGDEQNKRRTGAPPFL